MKFTKIIPQTIPILILRHEKPEILSKIGQNVPYLVVLEQPLKTSPQDVVTNL